MSAPALPDGFRWGVEKRDHLQSIRVRLYHNGNVVDSAVVDVPWLREEEIVERVEKAMKEIWLCFGQEAELQDIVKRNWP